MRIVLDALGGDHGPEVLVAGAVAAARAYGCQVTLAGPQAELETLLATHDTAGLQIEIADAPEAIAMHEHAAQAVRRKPGSPQAVGLRLVREGQAQAFVSAGHSGATMAGGTLILGRAAGVERPALAALFPTLERPFLLLDMGANTDCKPEWLAQFAALGSRYAEQVLAVPGPRVALLANGEEDSKGDQLVQEAHALLRQAPLNFVGNAEPKDALSGELCDVLVADGFVGNMFLKTAEAVAKMAVTKIAREARRGLPLRLLAGLAPTALLTVLPGAGRWRASAGALLGGGSLLGALLAPPLRTVRQSLDYRATGGAVLLGVNGVVIVAHGKSDALAVQNAVRQAIQAARLGLP
jgi:glycerol-3-phosphate acyltransferase PlsX